MVNSNKGFIYYSYLFGIFLLAISLPFSKALISISELVLFLSWIVDKNLIEKIKSFLKNKTALILSSVFILHLIGLTYTTDFDFGLEDVKKKIPLMLLPLIFSTSPQLSKNIFEKLLALFTVSVLAASFICFFVLLGFTGKDILQPQDASVFMSHIRFALLIVIAIFILAFFIYEKKSFGIKILSSAIILWLIAFLIVLESATGIICITIISILLFVYFIIKTRNILLKIVFIFLFMLFGIFIKQIVFFTSKEFNSISIDNKSLLKFTKHGLPYSHDTTNKEMENGNYVWLYFCEKETAGEWNKKSKIQYGGKDLKGNEIKYTLIRFLTSKGLPKDSGGVNSLSEDEIHAIEKGIANVNYMGVFNPTARMQKIIWEINNSLRGGNPSGHSVVQRLEFWKAAIGIIKENLLFGVGTGDLDIAFAQQYEKTNSPLKKEFRLRSHNQFLATAVAFGIVGLIWFLFSLFYPMIKEKKYFNYFYFVFFVTAFLSMLTEDTLESQAGVTFFAFFNSLFLFGRKSE